MAAEKRLIYADRLKKVFEDSLEGTYTITDPKTASVMAGTLIACGILIDEQPTVDAVEVEHGRWEWLGPNRLVPECMCGTCSVCKVRSKYILNIDICPNCGAKMDRREEDGK